MTTVIRADMMANVWRVLVAVGDNVRASDEVVILESMKMEIPVLAGVSGTVASVPVAEGGTVIEGDELLSID